MPSAISVNMLRRRLTSDCPAALKERPAAPQHDRRRERELHPDRGARGQRRCQPGDDMLGHRHDQQRHRQRDADPEAPRHVGAARGCSRRRRSASSAPAPCRRSGSCPARRARSRGCIGQVHSAPAGGRRRRAPACRRQSARVRRRTARGSARCRRNTRGRHARRGGARSPGPRSCRRPDRSPTVPPAAARGRDAGGDSVTVSVMALTWKARRRQSSEVGRPVSAQGLSRRGARRRESGRAACRSNSSGR